MTKEYIVLAITQNIKEVRKIYNTKDEAEQWAKYAVEVGCVSVIIAEETDGKLSETIVIK